MLSYRNSEKSEFNFGISKVSDTSPRSVVRLVSKRQVDAIDANPESSTRSIQMQSTNSSSKKYDNSFRLINVPKFVPSLSAESALEVAPITPANVRIIPGLQLQRHNSRRIQTDAIDQRINVLTTARRDSNKNGIVEEVRTKSGKVLETGKEIILIHKQSHIFDLKNLHISNPDFQTELIIGQFTKVTHLTDGSNSNIFKANIATTNQAVVLKVIKDSVVTNAIAVTEFAREALIISKLRHPNILTIYGTGQVQSKMNAMFQRPLLALEALDGGSLTYHMKISRPHNSFPFTVPRYMRIAKEFADALYYLHEKFHSECTIIHRDLKPDNIGFTADGVLKLMDFGLSISVNKNVSIDGLYTLTGETGSRRYMAPEIGLHQRYNEKVDIYAYGVILYEIMTGTTPFSGFKMDKFDDLVFRRHNRPPMDYDIYGRVPKIIPPVKSFIERCWDKESAKRPTAREALDLFTKQEAEAKSKNKGFLNMFSRKDTI